MGGEEEEEEEELGSEDELQHRWEKNENVKFVSGTKGKSTAYKSRSPIALRQINLPRAEKKKCIVRLCLLERNIIGSSKIEGCVSPGIQVPRHPSRRNRRRLCLKP